MDIRIVEDKQTGAKNLELINANGKCVTITAGMFAIDADFEPAVVLSATKLESIAGILASGSTGTRDIDRLIAGLYAMRAHYRKLGGR